LISDDVYLITDHTHSQACPECGAYAFRFEEFCNSCKLNFGKVFLPELVATYSIIQMEFDHNGENLAKSSDKVLDIYDIDYLYGIYSNDEVSKRYELGQLPDASDQLCCNRTANQCNCERRISFVGARTNFQSNFLVDSEISFEEAMYVEGTNDFILCESCINYSKYTCKPLRNALRMADLNPTVLEYLPTYFEIVEPCFEYEPKVNASEKDVEAVMVYLKRSSEFKQKIKQQEREEEEFNTRGARVARVAQLDADLEPDDEYLYGYNSYWD
jgi:hypothetical protein